MLSNGWLKFESRSWEHWIQLAQAKSSLVGSEGSANFWVRRWENNFVIRETIFSGNSIFLFKGTAVCWVWNFLLRTHAILKYVLPGFILKIKGLSTKNLHKHAKTEPNVEWLSAAVKLWKTFHLSNDDDTHHDAWIIKVTILSNFNPNWSTFIYIRSTPNLYKLKDRKMTSHDGSNTQ